MFPPALALYHRVSGRFVIKVLVVDDSATVRERLVEILSTLQGVEQVGTASRASEARDAIRATPPDVVVLDIHMPGGSGLEVLEELRAHEQRIMTIVLTNDPAPQWRDACVRGGADFFFDKSADFQQAIDVIARLALDHAGQHRDLVLAHVVSEPILAEAALRSSESRYRELFESVTDAIFTTDLELNLTSFNGVARTLTGFSLDETRGLRVADLVTPDSLKLVQQALADQLADKPAPMFEAVMLARDGRQVIVEIGLRLVYREGQPFGTLGIARDITRKRDLEEQVRQSQKMESVGSLAGGIAHDFNNLLTAIAGYGELLVDRLAGDPAALEDLGEIRRAVASAMDLTRQLLAFSRKQLLARRTVSLNDVVTELQKMLRRLIEENVRIDVALLPDLDRVSVDPGQIEQVLVNLAVNARDAMPEGGVLTIETANVLLDDTEARAHAGMRPGPHVMLSVSDTGLGMTADVQARVFEPFFTTKAKGQGTGFGLATVDGIVRQNSGYIRVNSRPGVGTTFKLFFPVASGEPLPEPARSRPVSGKLTGTETVLIVEDDARLRALDARILQRYGYIALVAESAADARHICTEHAGPIDVVLTDVIMPGGSGRTVGDWIREHRPETRVVYMSGYTDTAIARHAVLEPGTHFLQKPFTPDTLARKNGRCCRKTLFDSTSPPRH